jgi:hypothetical protein
VTDPVPAWVYEPFGNPVDVDLSAEGAQWEHHLSAALSERVPHGSFSGSRKIMEVPGSGSLEYIEYEARESGLRSKLWVTVKDRWVLIAGDGPEDEAQVSPWVEAVLAAKARMAEEHPVFRWVALIGPAPSDHEPGMGLTEPATIGPLELRPGGVRHIEHVRLSTPSLSGMATFQSWPVIVEGTASGYNWWPAREAAMGDLNRLCALLTASFGRAWIIRQSPGMVEGDKAEFAIPDHGPFEQHYGSTELAHSDVAVPGWLDRAWDVAVDDELASDALSAHYEGMLIKDAHSSFALLAFVSAIEAVGQTRLPTERCTCCKQVTKNTERFRQALRLVVSEEEVTALTKMAYGPRSKTVHAAKLHGREAVRGSPSLANFFGLEASYLFEIATVRQLEQASRQLVQRLLKGEIGE